MAMDLPKGIVVNSPGISQDVDRINREPVASDVLAKLWKVYTTTQRTLRDPTAERLENYWWRIWGSRQRELRGATVAKLFDYISNGYTFNGRPLLSKFNRYEGDQTTQRIRNGENADSNASVTSSGSSNARPSSSPRGLKKSIGPMPHPILKKSRGPSHTGPRPTARFVSPHGSEDERETQVSSSPNEHVIVRPPTPDLKGEAESKNLLKVPQPSTASKKKGKGHVVATVAGRRRPAIVRRKSSQSAGEEQEIRERVERRSTSRDKSPIARNREDSGNSAKKIGASGGVQQLKSTSNKPSVINHELGVAGPGPSTQFKARENARLGALENGSNQNELTEEELNELELQRTLLAEAKARKEARDKKAQPSGGKSEVLRQNLRSVSLSNLKSAGDATAPVAKGKASVASGYENAAGEINVEASTSKETKKIDKGKGREEDLLAFPKRAVPSLIAKNKSVDQVASPPFSKSQSQLALLLKQDRVRTNEQHGKGKDREKSTETEEDTQDEGLFMAPRGRKNK